MAILSIMVVNNHGQPRLLKFYKDVPHQQRDAVVRESFQLVSKRPDTVCNFLEGTEVRARVYWRTHGAVWYGVRISVTHLRAVFCVFACVLQYWGKDVRLIYRHYATLYFIFAVDEAESELGILDLIQVFVESLDKCFENVCELDLIFHIDKSDRVTRADPHGDGDHGHSVADLCEPVAIVCHRIHFILDEIVMGGMVLETSLKEILKAVNGTLKYARDTQAQAEQNTKIGRKANV
jgi:AP-3 complex subunit sigma